MELSKVRQGYVGKIKDGGFLFRIVSGFFEWGSRFLCLADLAVSVVLVVLVALLVVAII